MRHLKAGRRLGVTTAHRRAMMRNMVTSLVEHEQIKCTLARAKELRKPLDKMITLGKRGDLHSRRQALKFVKSKKAMIALFGELAERYKNRNGGYSRIIKLAPRRLGDGAEMVIMQLIDGPKDVLSEAKKKHSPKKSKPRNEILQEVSQEISTETNPQLTDEALSETKEKARHKPLETEESPIQPSAESSEQEPSTEEESVDKTQK